MCLIVCKEPGIKLIPQLTEQAYLDNPHGWGLAMVVDGELVVRKGMDKKTYTEEVSAIPVDAPAIIHTRITSKGKTALYNNHPFLITSDVVMMHNGTLSVSTPFENMSDTWHFAHRVVAPILERKPELYGSESLTKLLSTVIGPGNKLAFLNTAGQIWIVNEKQGTTKEGLWLSNSRSNFGPAWHTNNSVTVFHSGSSTHDSSSSSSRTCMMCKKNEIPKGMTYWCIECRTDNVYV